MNIIEIFQSFQTQEQAIDYFEGVRWHGKTVCPYCGSDKVCRHASGDRASMRWQCEEGARAGMYEYAGTLYPRIQFLTASDVLEGKREFRTPTKLGSRAKSGQASFAYDESTAV